jgi:hypothetical protein
MATPGQTPLDQDAGRIISLAAQLQSSLFGVTDAVAAIKTQFKDLTTETAGFLQNTTKIKNLQEDIMSLAAKLGKEYVDQEKVQEKIAENAGIQKKLEAQRDVILSRNTGTGLNELDTRKKIQDLIDRGVRITKQSAKNQAGVSAEEYRLYLLSKQIDSTKNNARLLGVVNKKIEAGNNQFKEMNVKAAALSKIFGTFSGIPFLKDFMEFKILSDAFKKGTKAGFTELGSQLKTILTNPLFLAAAGLVALVAGFKALVKLAFDYDKLVTSIANNTALSKTAAVGLLDAYRNISDQNAKTVNALNAGFLSVKNQANAFIELGETLETNAMFTNDMVQNQILLTKQMKMSKEEATGIQKLSLLTGQSAEKILNTAMKQNTSVISYKKIFSEIAKINSEIATAYKNNPELIAKAVVEANKLGMSLEQTKSISKSLLDFETSISGELESELLLGKQFNFEKARALALDGKSVEAAAELMGQIGGINALTQMNVIQRERLAASIGMSAEELTKSAREQAVLNALGQQNRAGLEERYEYLRKTGDLAGIEQLKAEAARKEGGQALLQDIARANLQDRFNESMERIKQIFTEVAAGPMIQLISGFAKLLENTFLLKTVAISLVALFGAIAASAIIASGGAALIGAAAAVAVVGGVGLYGANSAMGGKEDMAVAPQPAQPSMPTRNNNFPSYNNNQGGYNNNNNQNTGTSQTIQTTAIFKLNDRDFATAIATSNHTSGK